MIFEYSQLAEILGMPVWLIVIVAIWSLVWKGFALWRAGRENSPIWFIVLLVVNTVGILEIVYLFGFSKKARERRKKIDKRKKIR